jgi:acyl-CoA thioester hydrolase
MTEAPDLTDKHSYRFWYQEKVRFSDTDMLGHVNNTAFTAFVESGRVAFTRSGVVAHLAENLILVMARLEIDYRAELHYPADVDVGGRLMRIGRSSMVTGNGVFHGAICAATALTTLVLIDAATRRPTPIPDATRAVLEAYLAA